MQRSRDPVVIAAMRAARALALAPGQIGSLQRLQLDEQSGRDVGPTIALRVAHDARVLLTTERLRARWIAAPCGFRWAKVWETRGYRPLGLRLPIDGTPFDLWQLDLGGMLTPEYVRAAYLGGGAVALTPSPPTGVAPDIATLRAGLSAVADPTAFAKTALLGHPLFRGQQGSARWDAWVEQQLGAIGKTERGRRWARAIRQTYLEPTSGSQEDLAEHLGLPFRTYRDHLARGLEELQRRLGG
jgi:hypothetical protein